MQLGSKPLVAALATAAMLAVACSGGSGPEGGTSAQNSAVDVAASPPGVPAALTAEETLSAFVGAWTAQNWEALAGLVAAGSADPVGEHQAVYDELAVGATKIVVGTVDSGNDLVEAELEVTLTLDRLGEWTYPTSVQLVPSGAGWAVAWSPATLYPALREGRRLSRLRIWPERGELLAWDERPLRTDVAVVAIGIEPQSIEDQTVLLAQVAEVLAVDANNVADDLDAPGVQPDWFVHVKTVRADEYASVAQDLEGLPGLVIREGTDRLGPTDGYASQLLGATGPITAEQLGAWGEPYDASSTVGKSGLELSFEAQLAGTPVGEIRLLDAGGQLLSVVQRFPGRQPENIRTTVDIETQGAAEAALDPVEQPSALVAIDTATGHVRALVSRPVDEFGRANAGAYPPGSTFKTVTAAAYVLDGAGPSTVVNCPGDVVVSGLPFTNAGGSALGPVSLQRAYAASCNTAFVNVSTEVDSGALRDAAAQFGFGLDYTIGLTTVGGAVPEPIDAAEHAASAIGQGRVTASPLHMASVAAAVASGRWQQPVLVLDPAASGTVGSVVLPDAVVEALQPMMRSAVVNGTGRAVAGAGSDISGKTGSAEFGDDDPPQTHAWFVGYRDGLAFAVLIEGGGAGGLVAAPVASDFLARLDAARS